MNHRVTVFGSLLDKPVVLNALIANNSPMTQISRRLAQRLGLQLRDAFVGEGLGLSAVQVPIRWKVSIYPIVIKYDNLTLTCYPIVNGNPDDAFYEMILGQEIFQQLMTTGVAFTGGSQPTPGPSYEADVMYMGHNIRRLTLEEIPRNLNEFLELSCNKARDIRRLAFNRVSRQVAVIYEDSNEVHIFSNVPEDLMDRFEHPIFEEARFGEIVAEVKERCAFIGGVGAQFPEAVIVK